MVFQMRHVHVPEKMLHVEISRSPQHALYGRTEVYQRLTKLAQSLTEKKRVKTQTHNFSSVILLVHRIFQQGTLI